MKGGWPHHQADNQDGQLQSGDSGSGRLSRSGRHHESRAVGCNEIRSAEIRDKEP